MRKWRPTHKCIYVIPEVHGNMNSLEVILNRILPLRKFKNQEDVLIMLGDYIDGDNDSYNVIETLITIKNEYKDRVILLKGNHEDYLLKAIYGSEFDFNNWINSNGTSTLNSYAEKSNLVNRNYSRSMVANIVPQSHIDFIKSLENFYILDDYMFFHGSFDHNKLISENNVNNFIYDSTASKYTKERIKQKSIPEFKDNYIFVGSHNFNSKTPFIYSKYFMLGGGAPEKLIVFELNSMEACAATKHKSRIYKTNFKYHE